MIFAAMSIAALTGFRDDRWDDIRVPVQSASLLGFSDPDWVQLVNDGASSRGVYALAFDGSTAVEEVFVAVQLPHDWKQESAIYPHLHWAPSSAADCNVKWQMEYSFQEIDGVFGNTTTITVTDSSDSTDRKHLVAEFPAIDMTGVTSVSAMLTFRIFRDPTDGADTCTADAFLLEADVHYIRDARGSILQFSKT